MPGGAGSSTSASTQPPRSSSTAGNAVTGVLPVCWDIGHRDGGVGHGQRHAHRRTCTHEQIHAHMDRDKHTYGDMHRDRDMHTETCIQHIDTHTHIKTHTWAYRLTQPEHIMYRMAGPPVYSPCHSHIAVHMCLSSLRSRVPSRTNMYFSVCQAPIGKLRAAPLLQAASQFLGLRSRMFS